VIEGQSYTPKGTLVRGRLPQWLLGVIREEATALREVNPAE